MEPAKAQMHIADISSYCVARRTLAAVWTRMPNSSRSSKCFLAWCRPNMIDPQNGNLIQESKWLKPIWIRPTAMFSHFAISRTRSNGWLYHSLLLRTFQERREKHKAAEHEEPRPKGDGHPPMLTPTCHWSSRKTRKTAAKTHPCESPMKEIYWCSYTPGEEMPQHHVAWSHKPRHARSHRSLEPDEGHIDGRKRDALTPFKYLKEIQRIWILRRDWMAEIQSHTHHTLYNNDFNNV